MSSDWSEFQVRVPGVRQDILAVGYGQFEFGPPLSGLVALWSLKNPGYPLWSFPTPSGVTAVDSSVHNPNMLAVGLYDGTLAVHDVKTRQASFHSCICLFACDQSLDSLESHWSLHPDSQKGTIAILKPRLMPLCA